MPLKRLKKRAQFDQAMGGRVLTRSKNFVLHHCDQTHAYGSPVAGQEDPSQNFATVQHGLAGFGTLTPKRWAKSSVRRNAIRRIFFELVRQQLSATNQKTPTGVFVLRLNRGFDPNLYSSAVSETFKIEVHAQLLLLLAPSFNPTPCKPY